MKTLIYIVLIFVGLALGGCRFPDGEAKINFKVIAVPGMSTAILLNETTGESWRLTDSEWQPIPKQKTSIQVTPQSDSRQSAVDEELKRRGLM